LDENTLISGSYDKLLKIWDIRAVILNNIKSNIKSIIYSNIIV